MAAVDTDKSLRRYKRYPSSSTAPRLVKDSEGGSLRRSTRVGRLPARYSHSVTTSEPPSHFPLSASNKRKRTSSISKERSTGRAHKRSHIIQADSSTADYPPPAHYDNASSTSSRSQRHRRRHPSVFDDEVVGLGASQATASTSYLLPPPVDTPVESMQRRTRKKENIDGERNVADFGNSSSSLTRMPTDTPTLKGKERDLGTSSLTRDDASAFHSTFSIGRSFETVDDDLLKHSRNRSKPTSPSSSSQKTSTLPSSADRAGVLTHSDKPPNSQSDIHSETSPRRPTSLRLTKATTKRKRTSSAGVQTGKKKVKTIEPKNLPDEEGPDAPTHIGDAEARTDVISESAIPIPTTLSYPMSLPNPIPTLSVTPPTPPNSPPSSPAPDLPPVPCDHSSDIVVEDRNVSSSGLGWDWPTGTQPVSVESSALQDALSSASAGASSSPNDNQRGRPPTRTPRGKRIRRRQVSQVTDRPPETLFKLACRERVDYLRYYYLGQLQDYEADQAFEFFTRVSASSKVDSSGASSFTADENSTASTSSSTSTSHDPHTRPQSPTWSIVLHWEDRLQDAGEWDGHIHDMHPLSPPISPVSSPTSASQDISDREPDFRTEDYFPFELAESDDEEEELPMQPPSPDTPNDTGPSSAASAEEEHEDTESDESDESEDFPSVQVEGEMQLMMPAYTPTPSSLAEALTPLAPSESSQNFSTSVFALPVPLPPKKPELPQDSPPFVTRSPSPEDKDLPPPPPLSIPPPPLATIVPAQMRPLESDQLSETFQQEILPACQADKVRALFQNDIPTTFSPTCPSVLRTEIRRQADIRLRTPYTRLLNYASRKLGSIGHGTPIDPNRRRNLIAWLEDRKIVQHLDNASAVFTGMSVPDNGETPPPLGSAAWYATRFPSTLSSHSAIKSTVRKSNTFTMSTGSIASSPQALLDGTHQRLDRHTSFNADWPPLTVQPGDLETFRNNQWTDAKAYLGNGVPSSDIMQNVEFQQESSRGCGTNEAQYQYSQAGDLNHGVTPNADGNLNHNAVANVAPSRFSPEIAMDENLSDEDAEGDIDPDVIQPVSVSGFTNPSFIDPASSGRRTVALGNDSYTASTSAGMDSFSALPLHSSDGVGFGSSGSSSEFHDGSQLGIYGSPVELNANDIVGHGVSNVEIPHSGSVPSRYTDLNTAGFPDSGFQGVGMNRFGMDMMGVGLGMIGFPVVETDSWFVPASSPPSSPVPSTSTNGEHHDHGVSGTGAFGNNTLYNDSLPDHARERFGSPGSPESAYPLGFAMG
ncbi:hypothetical protein J3R30DRAFT_3451074 [Lentinula aciculospora]|uniref:Uncharacterized protein n=1 Tax=Lentinula aciculospora TaxID=153920 RepID=A0A9W9DS10_9AGAR|nr:hypothetical protein J3R30DRAFT_3451074 [Lentinula aciculospora]